MDLPERNVVTIKDIARRVKLALSTVSYSLRNHPRIPPETRARVQAAARELGYRPNPRVASLMAHIRRAQSRTSGERIAFIWMHTSRTQAARDPFLRKVFQGASQRAQQTGFALEEFWTSDPGMTDRRLLQIIVSRGIVGVVLSPVTTDEITLTLDWDWSQVAPAVVGNVTWTPELHHAGHHHFMAMQQVLHQLAGIGCKRPAALIERTSNLRAKRAWEAAFVAHHPSPADAPSLVRVVTIDTEKPVDEWFAKEKPDALIVSQAELLDVPGVREAVQRLSLPIVTLYWSEKTAKGIGGIDQCYDRIAAHAVDLVVAQLNNNESGIPDLPRIMLFPGRWIAPRFPIAKAKPSRSG